MGYDQWVRDGRPLTPARPIRDLVGRIEAAHPGSASILGWYADDAHYRAVPPEDHTPYSSTEWPVQCPRYVVFATDIMPYKGYSLDALADYWVREARAGRMPWLKYLIYKNRIYLVWRNFVADEYFGEWHSHIHVSARSDYETTELGSWNPLATTTTGDEADMTPEQAQQALIDAWRLDALQTGSEKVRGGPLKGETMWVVTAVKAQQTAVDSITRSLGDLAEVIAAVGHNSPEVAEILAQVQTRLDDQTKAIEKTVSDTVVALAEGGAAEVRRLAQ